MGLFGLAGMLLLVGLANIINDRARMAEAETGRPPATKAMKHVGAQNDPLAEIGVVPATTPDRNASSTGTAAPRDR